MGLIKNGIQNNINWLNKYGFEYDEAPVAGNYSGYERGYYHKNDLEFLWINICFPKRKVYLYNEYSCGGMLWERELDIPNGIYNTDEEEFINWLDEELDIE
jgi:hypothetical protein